MAFWIFKLGHQKVYDDVLGEKYIFDNTHSVKVSSEDYFIYLSTKKSRYEFTGYGKIYDLTTHEPKGKEKRNAKVRKVYTAYLTDVKWFGEPLDFSIKKGQINRDAVGITNALGWGHSIINIEDEMFWRIVSLAQPGGNKNKPPISSQKRKGSPNRVWLKPRQASDTILNKEVKQDFEPESFNDARERTLRYLAQRQGQPKFRKDLLEAYGNKCAITGYDIVHALQAAHIYPYRGRETNTVTNGLLLRSDIHDLFDLGLITINTSNMTVQLHDALLDSSYSKLQNVPLHLPQNEELHPSKVYLDYHRKWWENKVEESE